MTDPDTDPQPDADTGPDSSARRRFSRRGLLTGVAGAAVGAAAVGAWWLTNDKPPVVTTALPTTDRLGHSMLWTTLGTMSGPIGSATRAQPANLLHNNEHAIVVDAGDGVVDQLNKAGVPLMNLQTVALSHLHVDHTAGLQGIIGRRLQTLVPTPLTIYGPPGTQQEVERIQASLQYLVDLMSAGGLGGQTPSFHITVQEITDGSTFDVGPVKVTAATNSHYSFDPGSAEAKKFQSLAYRFDMTDRSIAFTGDTGPSTNVERLARGADLLVSEIGDAESAVAMVKAMRPDLPALATSAIKNHFEKQHLSAENVGLLAKAADVKAVVLTHNPLTDAQIAAAKPQIATHFSGPVAVADDLDNW
jgi:ribonuclease BN (tRNA processing enzyme)